VQIRVTADIPLAAEVVAKGGHALNLDRLLARTMAGQAPT